MSLIVVSYVREGIVMASDSRLSLSNQSRNVFNVTQSDNVYKTFLTNCNRGISTYGTADINGVPIAGFIDTFIEQIISGQKLTVKEVADELLKYFVGLKKGLNTFFKVGGYNLDGANAVQEIYDVDVAKNTVKFVSNNKFGATWGGESSVLTRLLLPTYTKDNNNQYHLIDNFPIDFNFFTIQDAIDFCRVCVATTISTMQIKTMYKTVGGEIDILLIKPNSSKWIQRKELH